MQPLKFKPIFMERIWGGDALKTKYGFNIPYGKKIGELWCISDNRTAVSEVEGGSFDGVKLNELAKQHKNDIYGEGKSYDRFPLLIKIIDANDKLSVQVHPDDDYAYKHENGDLGKTEMWYIIDAKPGAKLVCGLKEGTTKEQFKTLLDEGRLEDCLNEIEVDPGDVVYIPSGMVHAIGSGILICEIQQNSDLTYRVYDYNRVDANGKKRELHVDKALDVIDFDLKSDKIVPVYKKVEGGSVAEVVRSKYFNTDVINIDTSVIIDTKGIFNTLVVVEGECELVCGDDMMHLKRGESVLIPASIDRYIIDGKCKVVRSYI
ncbi:MAG: mannose-6-phosphate isomerase, class I [Thermoanaerobacterium thermosaccharolyticum]|jgi:mannose-6-phosphate isomerase